MKFYFDIKLIFQIVTFAAIGFAMSSPNSVRSQITTTTTTTTQKPEGEMIEFFEKIGCNIDCFGETVWSSAAASFKACNIRCEGTSPSVIVRHENRSSSIQYNHGTSNVQQGDGSKIDQRHKGVHDDEGNTQQRN